MYQRVKNLIISLALIGVGSDIHSVRASELTEVTLNGPFEVRQVAQGVYAGEGFARSGEPVYFGMEAVSMQDRAEGWLAFRQRTELMASGWDPRLEEGGLLLYFAKRSHPDTKLSYSARIQQVTGYSESEFEAFMKRLYVQNKWGERDAVGNVLAKQVFHSNTCDELECVSEGYGGVRGEKNQFSYVAYVSKTPVTGRFQFPPTAQGDVRDITIKDFFQFYGDILVSVGIDENLELFHEVRNPKTFLDRGYEKLSLPLHGFTAAVVKEMKPDLQRIAFVSIPKVNGWLTDNFGQTDDEKAQPRRRDYTVCNIIQVLDEATKRGDGIPSDAFCAPIGSYNTRCIMDLESLKPFYTHPNVFREEHHLGKANPFKCSGFVYLEDFFTWASKEASMEIPLLTDDCRRRQSIVFETEAFVINGQPQRDVEVKLNGNLVKTVHYDLQNKVQKIHVPLPVDDREYKATISFVSLNAKSPTELGVYNDEIPVMINFKRMGVTYLPSVMYYH